MQFDDLSYPAQGIGLDFRRTYNSTQAQLEAAGSLPPSQFGNGWTNTWNAQLLSGTDASGHGTLNVIDIDGARYTYTAGTGSQSSPGYWIPPAGEHVALTWDGANGYFWTKKSGTVYYFYSPSIGTNVPAQAAYAGKIKAIYSRNYHANLAFTYQFQNNDTGTSLALLQTETVTHSNGAVATMQFADAGGRRVMTDLIRPDGADIHYSYDASANLIQVNTPGFAPQDQTATPPPGQTGTSVVTNWYSYGTTNPQYVAVASPRGVQAWNGSTYTDGVYVTFYLTNAMTGYNGLSSIGEVANVNPTFSSSGPYNDNYSTPGSRLQPSGPTNFPNAYTWGASLYIGAANGTSVSQLVDTDGHVDDWFWYTSDTQSRVVLRGLTNDTAPTSMAAYYSWSADNQLNWETDLRSTSTYLNATNYLYDANGNTIAEAAPAVTDPVTGASYRPTSWYGYDAQNNVIAYCDPTFVHAVAGDWPTSTDGIDGATTPNCTATSHGFVGGSTVYPAQFAYTYHPCTSNPATCATSSTGYDPDGELTTIQTPLGYGTTLSYSASGQGGTDYGQPTQALGASYTQYDNTSNQDSETLTYGVRGTITTFNNGVGTLTFAYDSMNRAVSATDADNFISYKAYNQNGTLRLSASPSQHATGTGASFAYDQDGDLIFETHHHGCPNVNCTAGVTTKIYDGKDRLIEVKMPWDPTDYSRGRDLYPFPWMTRYLYDISQSNGNLGTQSLTTMPYAAPPATPPPAQTYGFTAHGNLAKTQECIYQPYPTWPIPNNAPCHWQDLEATAFDRMDRLTATFNVENGVQMTNTYDSSVATQGLLAQTCDNMSRCDQFAYDLDSRKTNDTFSVPSGQTPEPNRAYTFDPNGRMVATSDSLFGSEAYAFDGDGRVAQKIEPEGNGYGDPLGNPSNARSLTYSYYQDGKPEFLDAASYAANPPCGTVCPPPTWQSFRLSYSYKHDGQLQSLGYNGWLNAGVTLGFTYDAAGKMTGRGENTTDQARAYSYTYHVGTSGDTYGRLSQFDFPAGPLSGITYDDEDRQLSQVLAGKTDTFVVNIRGELLSSVSSSAISANGLMIDTSPAAGTGGALSGQIDAILGRPFGAATFACPPNTPTCALASWSERYDPMGNLVVQYTSTGTEGQGLTTSQTGRTFDFEHHTIEASTENVDAQTPWGPNGHALLDGYVSGLGSLSSDALHWDGSDLLYTTAPGGIIDDVKLGAFGDVAAPQAAYPLVTYLDRDPSGTVLGCHNSSASHSNYSSASASLPNPRQTLNLKTAPCSGNNAPNYVWANPRGKSGVAAVTVGTGGVLSEPRTDGFSDNVNTFQGVRTYDDAAGVWTTPDAYAGNVHDPMTQKSYMWNGNNPAEYSDPSGYDKIYLNYRLVADPFDPKWDALRLLVFPGLSDFFEQLPLHAFIEIDKDSGEVVRYSFGEENGELRLEGQDFDRLQEVVSSTTLGDCTGTCTIAKGGLDEALLDPEAHAIDAAHIKYKAFGPNSNSAAFTLCHDNGGGSKCDGLVPGIAPGRVLLDLSRRGDSKNYTALNGLTDAVGLL